MADSGPQQHSSIVGSMTAGKDRGLRVSLVNIMQDSHKHFKKPPKRHQPRGLSILYEDRDILVVDKVSGMPLSSPDKTELRTAQLLLNDYVRKGNPKSHNQVFLAHRLDREASGILVVTKNEAAKRYFQDEWKNFRVKYVAVAHGAMPEKEGMIVFSNFSTL